MKLVRALSEAEAKKVQTIVLLGGVFTTLAIWTKLEDPINLPKMFVLVLFAAVVLGLSFPVLLNIKSPILEGQRFILALLGLFGLGLLISTLATDVKYTAILGEYHRNNGALSYFSMVLLTAVAALIFDLKSSGKYLKFYAVTGLILTIYGFVQSAGKDPVSWKIDYNPFITTLGNPNFTSAALGLSGVAILLLLAESNDRKTQVSWAICLLADLYILKRSGSIQGLFGFLLGAAIIILIKLWLFNKKFGRIGLVVAAIAGTPVGLAVLNIGPLASKLYQGTLKNRLDYWHAAINMFRDHPIFGVGIDRFGEYYRQYAVQNQEVQGQITDNAHSVYMQLLATGGLVLFIPYMALIFCITYIGIRSLIRAEGNAKLRIGGVLGIWLGTVAINIVAIDNLGVAVWFWITGGVLIATSRESADQSNPVKKKTKSISTIEFPVTNLIASCLVILVLILLLPILGKSQELKELKSNPKRLDANAYVAELNRQVTNNQDSAQNLILLADVALRQGELELSYQIDSRIRELDPRSFYGHYLPAIAYEASGKPAQAIVFREKLVELDPWNTSNMLQLIKDYIALNDKTKASAIAKKINENYPGSPADLEASTLLAG